MKSALNSDREESWDFSARNFLFHQSTTLPKVSFLSCSLDGWLSRTVMGEGGHTGSRELQSSQNRIAYILLKGGSGLQHDV